MRRAAVALGLLVLLTVPPLEAQPPDPAAGPATVPADPAPAPGPCPGATDPGLDGALPPEALPWQTAWGLVGLRAIPAGPKVAPNGLEYHPNFSLDLIFNFWLWREHRLYLFADLRLWGQKGEDGVTNPRDGFMGTSKRQFDLTGGAAWNYAGPCELRAFGYTQNNLNRGDNLVRPAGFTDGFGLENRFYLAREYDRLGQAGFDVARASFLSIGYLPSKVLVGNDGEPFKPGLTLRAYLTCDLGDWPCYLYGDVQYVGEASLEPRLLLLDLGLALVPFRSWRQWEFRAGAESTADFQAGNAFNLWYGAVRYIF